MFILYLFFRLPYSFLFFFNDTATTEIYTLSLHDALPISFGADTEFAAVTGTTTVFYTPAVVNTPGRIAQDIQLSRHHLQTRSEEHTSELQSLAYLVCRLLLEKKKRTQMERANWRSTSKPD